MHCWLGRGYASPTGWQPTARIGLIMFHSTTQVFIEYTIAIPATLCYRYIQQPIHGTRSQVDWATQQSARQHSVGSWTTSRVSNEVSYSHCHSPDPMLLLYYSLMVSADQTTVLREGYWASYNVPFYEQVFQLSGYAEMAKQHGQEYTHDLAVRAEIFRRDQGNVTDMKSYQQLMQSNGWYKCTMLFCLLISQSIRIQDWSIRWWQPNGCHLQSWRSRITPNVWWLHRFKGTSRSVCSLFQIITINWHTPQVTDYHMAKNMTAYIRSGPTHQVKCKQIRC